MEGAIEGASTVPLAVHILWAIGLLLVIALVPVAIALLQRTLNAALAIQRYLAEMEAAGAGIADNTQATSALESTKAVAGKMLDTAGAINEHSGQLAGALSQRLERMEGRS